MTKRALIVVDVQNDFISGSLAVPNALEIIPIVNRLLTECWNQIIFTQDWHPKDHCSFKENGGPWPEHCVENSWGASVHKGINEGDFEHLRFYKGQNVDIDSYSAFWDNEKKKSTGLAEYLRDLRIGEVYICGLATDYCVKFSALDAIAEGFKTIVVKDACRGVDIEPGDSSKALDEVREAGADVLESDHLPLHAARLKSIREKTKRKSLEGVRLGNLMQLALNDVPFLLKEIDKRDKLLRMHNTIPLGKNKPDGDNESSEQTSD